MRKGDEAKETAPFSLSKIMFRYAKFLSPWREGNQRRLDEGSPKGLYKDRRRFFNFLLILPFLIFQLLDAQSEAFGNDLIQLIMPKGGCINIDARATIKCTIKKPFDPRELSVLLNGENLDRVDVKPDGFEYTGNDLLLPGNNSLNVAVTTLDGQESEEEFKFSVCPSKGGDETDSSERGPSSTATPDPKAEPGKKEGDAAFKTNPRFFNQNIPAALAGSRFGVMTPSDRNLNTLGTFTLLGGGLQLKTLYMRADQWAASSGTLNPAGNPLFPSFGSPGLSLDRRGDTVGGVLTSELWGKKLVAEAEINLSGFNGDTFRPFPSGPAHDLFSPFPFASDSAFNPFPFRRDNTYRLKLRGDSGNYNYEALYEYMSFDDSALGSQGMSEAMQGYMFKVGGKFFKVHSLNLSFSQYMDNIKGSSLSSRLTTTQAAIDYSFTKFESLPITLSYQWSMVAAKDDAYSTPGTRINMDTVTAGISYLKGPWNLGLQASYSTLKDMTDTKNDTNLFIFTFLPTYTFNRISIGPGFTFGRSESRGVNTDTYTVSLDLRGDLLSPKLTYGLGIAYTQLTTSDNSSKQDTLSANFNLFYSLPGKHLGFFNPSFGIMGLFGRTNDRILHQTRNDYEFFLMFQAKF